MLRITVENRARNQCDNGHPWVYRSSVLSADPGIADGDVVDAVDEKGRFVGRGFFNARSQIAFRLLTRRDEAVDEAFFARRADWAWQYRRRLADPASNCARLVFSESDFLPALIIDRFDDMLVFQSGCLGLEKYVPGICRRMMELCGARGVYERNDTPVRALEGLPQQTGLLMGGLNAAPVIRENGIELLVDIVSGQKTGYFLDQRENRAAIAPFVPGARPSNSSEDSTLMCSRIACASTLGMEATASDGAAACCCGAGVSLLPHAATDARRIQARLSRFMSVIVLARHYTKPFVLESRLTVDAPALPPDLLESEHTHACTLARHQARIPQPAKNPGLPRRRHPHARPWHRRQYRNLLAHGSGAVASLAGARSGRARAARWAGRLPGTDHERDDVLVPDVNRLPRSQ
jgi:hypothetical protein